MKSRLPYFSLALLFLTTGCKWNDEVRPDPSPWEYAQPSSGGLSENVLLDLDSVIKGGYLGDINSVLVLKDDKIVFENYYQFNTRDSLQNVSSMGNALVSLLVGFAIDDGYIQSVDDSIHLYLEEYESYFEADPLKRGIRFRHLLTMRSGISWNETLTSPFSPANDLNVITNTVPDRVAYLLSRPMESEAGQRYSQNSSASLLLLKAIESQLPYSIEEYLRLKLFDPLNIEIWELEKDDAGLANISLGLRMKPIDIMRIGYLAMQKGQWDENVVLSEAWIGLSTGIQHRISNFLDIGYLWWRFSEDSSWAQSFPENDVFYAASDDGQYLFVLPSSQLVFILNTPQGNSNNTNVGYFVLSNYILRALQPNSGN